MRTMFRRSEGTVESGKGEKMTDRSQFLGASEIPAVLGLSPFRSPLDVFLEKTGRMVQNPPSIPMRAGNLLEPLVIELFEERTGLAVTGRQKHLTLAGHPYISATIDGEVPEAIVEAKTTGSATGWGEEETDQVPEHILVQCVQQMAVSGFGMVWIPVLIGRTDFRIYRVERDVELENLVIARGVEFWEQNVLKDVAPEPRSLEDLKALFPVSKSVSVEATPEIAGVVETLSRLRKEEKAREMIEKDILFQIQSFLGDADTLTYGGKTLATWRSQERTIIDQKALKEAHPEIARVVSKTSSGRVFRLSNQKE